MPYNATFINEITGRKRPMHPPLSALRRLKTGAFSANIGKLVDLLNGVSAHQALGISEAELDQRWSAYAQQRYKPTDASAHFAFLRVGSGSGIPKALKEAVEEHYAAVASALGLQLDRKMSVNVYSDLSTLHKAMGWTQADDAWVGNYCNGVLHTVDPLGVDPSNMEHVLSEARWHAAWAYSVAVNPRVPMYLSAGLAQYFDDFDGGASWCESIIRDDVLHGNIPSLQNLRGFDNDETSDRRNTYGWGYVEFLTQKYGIGAVASLLKGESMSTAVALSEEQLNREWQAYLTDTYGADAASEHFVYTSIAPCTEVPAQLIDALEAGYADLTAAAGVLPDTKVPVVVYADRPALFSAMGWEGQVYEMDSQAFDDGTVHTVSPRSLGQMEARPIIEQETYSACLGVLNIAATNLPLYLRTGAAGYIAYKSDNRIEEVALQDIVADRLPSIDDLESLTWEKWGNGDAYDAYIYGREFVKFALGAFDHSRVVNLFHGQSIEQALGISRTELNERWKGYLTEAYGPKMPYLGPFIESVHVAGDAPDALVICDDFDLPLSSLERYFVCPPGSSHTVRTDDLSVSASTGVLIDRSNAYGDVETLSVVVKGDVQGSGKWVSDSL